MWTPSSRGCSDGTDTAPNPDAGDGVGASRLVAGVVLGLALAAIWLYHTPFAGLVHDARLYAVQALRLLYPANFANDIWFLHGSQDDYTLFSPLFAALIEALGFREASLLLFLAGHALWLGGAALVAGLLPGWPRWLFLALAVAMPGLYGPDELFTYAEPFLTPRLYAEALALLGLGLVLRGRVVAALPLFALGMALHPLMAVWGAALAWLLLARPDRRWIGAPLLALLAVLALAAAGVPPLDGLLHRMDPEWLRFVEARSTYLFPSRWPWEDISGTSRDVALLLAAALTLAPGPVRRLLLAAAALGAMGVAVSLVGGDLLHNRLVIQAQPWRALWLTHLFSWMAVAVLLGHWLQRPTARPAGVLLALSVLLPAGAAGPLAAAGLALIALGWRLPEPAPRATAVALAAGVLLHLALRGAEATEALENAATGGAAILPWILAFLERTPLLAVAAFAGALWAVTTFRAPRLVVALAALILSWHGAVGAVAWAGRERGHVLSSEVTESRVFTAIVPRQAVVYWQDSASAVWFGMLRASYASRLQAAGTLFSRDMALEMRRRLEHLRPLGVADADWRWRFDAFRPPVNGPIARKALEDVCRDPVLDFVVLGQHFPSLAVSQWHDGNRGITWNLYDCRALRARRAPAS